MRFPAWAAVVTGQPSAADVLREHWTFGGSRSAHCQCQCGEDVSDPQQHVADMLAAAGLLATPERLAQERAAALASWGRCLLDRYPEDVFLPPTPEAYDRVHRARGALGVTLDAMSADAMRRAARLAIEDAEAERARPSQ